jgi:putative flippase GtrA
MPAPETRPWKAELVRVFRYLIVGSMTNALVLAVYYALTLTGLLRPIMGLTVASSIGFVLTFYANKAWTFGFSGSTRRAMAQFAGGYLFSYAFQASFLAIGVQAFGWPHTVVMPLGIALATGLFYLAQRHWVFRMGR